MKLIAFLFVLLSVSADAQNFPVTANNVGDTSQRTWLMNSPTNTVGNRRELNIFKDSAWHMMLANRIYFWALKSTPNMGTPTSMAWFSADSGRLMSTPIGSVGLSLFNNDAGFITTAYNPSVSVAVSRPINSTAFTVSTTKQAFVAYNVTISCTATIGSAATGSIALQYSTNSGSSWNTVATVSNSNTVSLAIVLNSVQTSGLQVSGFIPANALVRLVPSTAGSTTITYLTGTEVY